MAAATVARSGIERGLVEFTRDPSRSVEERLVIARRLAEHAVDLVAALEALAGGRRGR